jgi:hypothetical protein
MQRDESLRQFVSSRQGADGMFRLDQEVTSTIERIAKKTAFGLLFQEYGRLVPFSDLQVIAMQHANNVHPNALTEQHRYAAFHGFRVGGLRRAALHPWLQPVAPLGRRAEAASYQRDLVFLGMGATDRPSTVGGTRRVPVGS